MTPHLRARNYRGVEVPVTLGFWLEAAGALSVAAVALFAGTPIAPEGWIAAGGAMLVFGAGLVDDLAPPGPRGLRGHARALTEGRVTTGIVKLLVIVGCSAVSVLAVPGRTGLARAAGIVLVAAATNLWNGLDVRPGRALKFFYPAGFAMFATPWVQLPFSPGMLLGSVLVLPWDAGERAMLGDAGANLLGFTAGMSLFHALHGSSVVVAVVVAVGLNILAETVTLSRAIEAVPPLRWYDALGRGPEPG